MNEVTRKAQLEKLKTAALAYYGAKKAKDKADKTMAEHRPTLLKAVHMLGDSVTPLTKRVVVAGLNIDVTESSTPKPADGSVDYVLENLPDLIDRLLCYQLSVGGVERAAADDLLTDDDLTRLITLSDRTVVKVAEKKK